MAMYPGQKAYDSKKKRLSLNFSPTPGEAELWEHLQKQPKKATYIKNLIRADMIRRGTDAPGGANAKQGKTFYEVGYYDTSLIFDDLTTAREWSARDYAGKVVSRHFTNRSKIAHYNYLTAYTRGLIAHNFDASAVQIAPCSCKDCNQYDD